MLVPISSLMIARQPLLLRIEIGAKSEIRSIEKWSNIGFEHVIINCEYKLSGAKSDFRKKSITWAWTPSNTFPEQKLDPAYYGRFIEFYLCFSIFLFVTLLLFTIFNNQNKMDLNGESTNKEIRLFGGNTVQSRIRISPSHKMFIIYFKNFNPIVHLRINPNRQQINSTKIDKAKIWTSNKHQE